MIFLIEWSFLRLPKAVAGATRAPRFLETRLREESFTLTKLKNLFPIAKKSGILFSFIFITIRYLYLDFLNIFYCTWSQFKYKYRYLTPSLVAKEGCHVTC